MTAYIRKSAQEETWADVFTYFCEGYSCAAPRREPHVGLEICPSRTRQDDPCHNPLRSRNHLAQLRTPPMSQRAFIIGGTGQIGRAVADELLTNGWDVTVSHRGHRALSDDLIARGAKLAVLDREEPGALASALGSGADAVIDTIAYTANHADQLLEIEPSVGSFIVISSSSVYRDPAGRTLDEARKGEFSGLFAVSPVNPPPV